MQISIRTQIEGMVELQNIEKDINTLTLNLTAFPEKIKAIDNKKNAFEQDIAAFEERQVQLKKAYRTYEAEIKANEDKLLKSQSKLNSVKTNKEYQALLDEADEIKAKNSTIEDEMLQCLEEIDNLAVDLVSKKNEFSTVQKQLENEKKEINLQLKKQKKELSDREKDKEIFLAEFPTEVNKLYQIVKNRGGGSAVAEVNDFVCFGCHMNIPPQLYNEVQRGDELKYCPHCERIIYWKEE